MIIKNTHYDYSMNIIHHDEYGNCFLGKYDKETKTYPAMNIVYGDTYDFMPTALIGCYLYDGIMLGFKEGLKI